MAGQNRGKRKIFAVMAVLAALVLFPVVYMILASFRGETGISVLAYYDVFLAEPGYLVKFWRSLGLCLVIALGQTLVSCLGGMAFSKMPFPGWKPCFLIMALFMILPIQVTLLPNYILLEKMNLLNTWWALILPAVFSPFGTVWLAVIFRGLPSEWTDAAKLDGAGLFGCVFPDTGSRRKTGRDYPVYFKLCGRLEHGRAAHYLPGKSGPVSFVRIPGGDYREQHSGAGGVRDSLPDTGNLSVPLL